MKIYAESLTSENFVQFSVKWREDPTPTSGPIYMIMLMELVLLEATRPDEDRSRGGGASTVTALHRLPLSG